MTELDPTLERPPEPLVRRLARDDLERKKFLKAAGKTVGSGAAASALAAFIAACGSSSSSSSSASAPSSAASSAGGSASSGTSSRAGSGDLAIVNYALTLEYLESQFYDQVGASGLFHGQTLATLKSFGAEEHAHVMALKSVAQSMGTPAAPPKGKFPLTNAASVAKLAATVENVGAAAYLGQAANITSKQVLAAALAIHTVEARHAATLNMLVKMPLTPDGAFAKPMTMAQVLQAVKPFIA